MKSKQLSYTVTSIAPQEIDQKFLEIKEKYDYTFDLGELQSGQIIAKNHAHITLKRNSYLRDGQNEESVITALQKVDLKPIWVRAEEVKIFKTDNHGNVIVILVNKSPDLLSLQRMIIQALEPLMQSNNPFDDDFTPHFSVFYSVPEERLEELAMTIQNEILPIEYTLESFLLLREIADAKGIREIVRRYRF